MYVEFNSKVANKPIIMLIARQNAHERNRGRVRENLVKKTVSSESESICLYGNDTIVATVNKTNRRRCICD